ncbi:MAG: 5-(carboxyamino)imidazole ribonucleotide synthase [Thiobacillaceae bacterium]
MSTKPILPGATLGILGGGQLGRMFTMAARSMGYQVIVLDPNSRSPAGQLADVHLQAGYDDHGALRKMGEACAAVTTEFENVPAASLNELSRYCRVAPNADAVAIVQDRSQEKSWLRGHGFATAPFVLIDSTEDLRTAANEVKFPAILKVSRFGYDAKGQIRLNDPGELRAAFEELKGVRCVLEARVSLDHEISVVLARNDAGECVCFPTAENHHRSGILDLTIVPARVSAELADEAQALARQVAEDLNYVGTLGVEFFVVDGKLLVNEIAPRPHNSGHYTLDACVTDQFEQQVKALCALPLGDARLLSPVVMVNLLGDIWKPVPDWLALLRHSGVKLHLYGKADARPGRKMGHYNCLAASVEDATKLAQITRGALGIV